MQNFFLIIDTETSGLPKKWSAPYTDKKNWPHIIQVSWLLYDETNAELKRENHYLECKDLIIEKSSQKIHHITEEFLMENGVAKEVAFNSLYHDLIKYQPLVIGHFIEFDFHMINVEFTRLGLPLVLETLPMFCTMKASAPFVKNPNVDLLKLNEFYTTLFNESPKSFHNAQADAVNTARIFFELLKTGTITNDTIFKQNNNFKTTPPSSLLQIVKKFFNRLFSLKA